MAALTIGLILASPVIGALIYAAGVRSSSRSLRVLGVAIAFGVMLAAAVAVAVSSGD